jgi:hypothetical protein
MTNVTFFVRLVLGDTAILRRAIQSTGGAIMCASFCHFLPPNVYKDIFYQTILYNIICQKAIVISKKEKNKKESRGNSFLFLLLCQLSLFYVENLLAVVVAANLAYAVGLEHLGASGVGALNKSGHSELGVVASSLISACFRHFSLRYCHCETSSRSCFSHFRI